MIEANAVSRSPSTRARAPDAVIRNTEPATGAPLPEIEVMPAQEVRGVVARAREAQKGWAALGFGERRRRLSAFKNLLMDRADEVGAVVHRENGKPLFEAITHDVVPVAMLTSYYARKAKSILRDRRIAAPLFPHKRSYVRYEPRGVIGVIAPWNFPFSLPVGEVVTALAAGNAVVVKPSEFTPLVMLEGKKLLVEAGIPEDLVGVVPGFGPTGAALIESGVDMVVFIGSGATGRKIAAACGERLIPCVLELGGKDPAIVCADADLEKAARTVVFGAFANSGQVCASVERVYVDRRIAEPFTARVVELAKGLRQGDGDVDVGAMTTPAQLGIVRRQVDEAVAQGAKVLTGGHAVEGKGRFFEPTVLTDVNAGMAVMREETFGPVLPIVAYDSEDDAVRLANDTTYGLNAYVFSKDRGRAERLANRIEAGTVMVNDVLYTHGVPEWPWGGVKSSGIGRTHGAEALREMCRMRHVNVERVAVTPPWLYPYRDSVRRSLVKAVRTVMRLLD
ncbi:MAG TPA: aldehyde dehydrogenase family protein [Myxococcales bacterium]|nr:aldehyde dehydrogenase family protein [Myxococcales bacterium]